MEKQEVDQVLIDGENSIFGGEIYNVSFRNNFTNGPSVISVSIVNEEGVYTKPSLSPDNFLEPYRIQMGDLFDANFYLVKTRSDISEGGKILQLTFWDVGFYLDKVYIGLHKKHGIIPRDETEFENRDSKTISENKKDRLSKFNQDETVPTFHIQKDEDEEITPLIILGREFHPCDSDLDGFVNLEEDIFKVDGCDPCPTCPEEKYESVLDRQKCLDLECSEIFEVKYNFSSLIEAVEAFFEQADIDIEVDSKTVPETNDQYYTEYEGTLRDVLSRWGADFGFNFYVEFGDDEKFKLKFFDTKVDSDIIALDDIKNNNILSFEEEESIENTQNMGSISLYKQNGEKRNYECKQNIELKLRPMYISDLYSNSEEAILGKGGEGEPDTQASFEDVEISIALGKYSLGMREHFWWGRMYGADKGREEIVSLLYEGPPIRNVEGPDQQEVLDFEIRNKFERNSISSSGGLTKSDGISAASNTDLRTVAKERGILQLGDFKPLAFFFPKGRDDEVSEIYYNRGTRFGEGPGKQEDQNDVTLNKIKEFWDPDDEELDFFANTPLFGSSDFDLEDGTARVDSFSKGYFVLASRKDELYNKILENEQNLADNFIGKYFAREIDITDELNMCLHDKKGRKDFRKTEITVNGGGEFYHFDDKRTQKFLENPLFSFGHSEGSSVGRIQGKIKDQKMRVEVDGDSIYDEGVVIQQTNGTWFPNEIRNAEIQTLIDIYERKKFKEIGKIGIDKETGEGNDIFNMVRNYAPEHIYDPNIKLFVVYPDDFSEGFSVDRDVRHPVDNRSDLGKIQSDLSSGCYGDCDENDDCFQGEANPERIKALEEKLGNLPPNSELARFIQRELKGDVCRNGECVPTNGCQENEDCGNWVTIGSDTYNDHECINGQCVKKLGLLSPICTRIDINGFPIFAPPHGFETPSNFIVVNENFSSKDYVVDIEYKKNVEILVPKVENIIQENIEKFDKSFAKFNINLYQIPLDDFRLFFRENVEFGLCSPNDEILETLHEEFNKELTYDIDQPFKRLNVTVPGINLTLDGKTPNVENGLESLDINFSSSGVTSTYTFSNRIAQPISIDLSRRLLDQLRKRERRLGNYRNFQFARGATT